MSRSRRSLERQTPFRDAKLIVIAAEGNRTEYTYFDVIGRKDWFFNPRVRVIPLERNPQTTGSDPESLIRVMDKYRRDNPELSRKDEFWIVVDRDPGNISAHQLATAKALCDSKGYRLCLSAPCFEIWFLMHILRLHPLRIMNRQALTENQKINQNRRYIEALLSRLLDGYDKSNPPLAKLFPLTETALHNARVFRDNNAMAFPFDLGTEVHELVSRLLPER